ncbi:MAG: 30S ribosomal protein S21 [Chloroflexi bacterium]|nr:30S ribosomal protein S21 [Chloroflexota bacterium]
MPTTVIARPGESAEELLKRFRKQVAKAGILSAVKRKRWYISKSELKRIKRKKAIRRQRRKMRKRMMQQQRRR